MKQGALIPIFTEHAQSVFSGRKRYEYRRMHPSKDITDLALYESRAAGKITGIAKVTGAVIGSPAEVWDITKTNAGITREYFRKYFSGKKEATAFCLGDVLEFEKALLFSEIGIIYPPQSLQYLDVQTIERLWEIPGQLVQCPSARLFVGGVHGLGKTTFSRQLAQMMKSESYSSSALIKDNLSYIEHAKKIQCNQLIPNQAALIKGLSRTNWYEDGGVLDGNFILFNRDYGLQRIPLEVFRAMSISKILVLYSKPERIAKRISRRQGNVGYQDGSMFGGISALQKAEREHAQCVASALDVPISFVYR